MQRKKKKNEKKCKIFRHLSLQPINVDFKMKNSVFTDIPLVPPPEKIKNPD